jgi:hypothetical protein
MKRLFDVAAHPTGFDSYSNYMGNKPDKHWLCVLTRTRDSECLDQSNWETALTMLGGESNIVQIFHFGHWACGWWEALAVKTDSPAEVIGNDIEKHLADYPILDESDFREREQAEADTVWRDCYRVRDRIAYIRKNRNQFEFHDYADLIGCVRGQYFLGYSSELVS